MIISVNWLKKFTDIDLPIDELATLIGARLVEIERVIDLGDKYKDVLVVKAVNVESMDGSDHLSIVRIDDGGVSDNIDRDEDGLIQVVCGAHNIRTGQLVAWLPPGSVVPDSYDKDRFTLDSRKLRGYVSNGMIASARELDLYDEHDGILVLDDDIAPGSKFAEVYELNDSLLDIENKSLTHRPDCFSIIGFAREVAAISGKTFKTPDWLINLEPNLSKNNSLEPKLNVIIDDPELSSRYQAVVVSGADSSKNSPIKIQTYLARVGVRPINAVVDVTNYLMMLTGQPLHAFDYDKLIALGGDDASIHVRPGKNNEELELLDGRLINISTEDIVIAFGETPVALAGAMGGANTNIDTNTKNIIIESATFNLYKLRATQMRHGIFSEAITRFTKGQPASLTAPVLFDSIRLMGEWSGAKDAGSLIESYPVHQVIPEISISADKINSILGSQFSCDDIVSTLHRAEFTVSKNDDGTILVRPPYWRADIHILEDIVEEIGRLNGFDNIKSVLPERDFSAVGFSEFDDFRERIRNILSRAGANEALTYSFLSGDIIEKAGQPVDNSYRIVNSISPSLQYYRQTLSPSLLSLAYPNIKQGYGEFAMFEINKTHKKSNGFNDEKVPIESENLALIYTSKTIKQGKAYYQAKSIIDYMFNALGVNVTFEPLDYLQDSSNYSIFEPRRSAIVKSQTTDRIFGVIGEYKKSVCRNFKLTDYTAGFELDLTNLFNETGKLAIKYLPISKYPSTDRDICFQVAKTYPYGDLINSLKQSLLDVELLTEVSPLDIYQPEDSETKNITFRIKFTSYDRTLNSGDIESITDRIIATVVADGKVKVI